MQYRIALASTIIGAAVAAPQGVTDNVAPSASAPSDCKPSYDGKFEITITKGNEKRSLNQVRR